VAANLILNGFAGWCPGSVIVHKLGVPTASERTLGDVGNRLSGFADR
jgi:hypothetical protein